MVQIFGLWQEVKSLSNHTVIHAKFSADVNISAHDLFKAATSPYRLPLAMARPRSKNYYLLPL